MLIAKFHIKANDPADQYAPLFELMPVSRGDRNARWASATPSGDMRVTRSADDGLVTLLGDVKARWKAGEKKHPEVLIHIAFADDERDGNLDDWMSWRFHSFEHAYHGCNVVLSADGNGSTTLRMVVNNPSAVEVLRTEFGRRLFDVLPDITPVWVRVVESFDAVLGDGHEFAQTTEYEEGVYYFRMCALCGSPADQHATL